MIIYPQRWKQREPESPETSTQAMEMLLIHFSEDLRKAGHQLAYDLVIAAAASLRLEETMTE